MPDRQVFRAGVWSSSREVPRPLSSGRAGWAYLRYRELQYHPDQLDEIATQVRRLTDAKVETFAFFRHGDLPDAPAAALRVASTLRGPS